MALLTRDQILAAQDIETEEVSVPEWGGAVRVRALTARQRDQFEASMVEERKGKRKIQMEDFRAKLCAITIVDEDGHRLFTNADVEALGAKSAGALSRVYDVAARLCGMTPEDVEELTGNSNDAQRGGLPSD